MRFYQRAFRYISRKRNKSILLFLCFLIISTMVLCAAIVLETAQAASLSMWEKTGTKIVLKNQRGENGIPADLIPEILKLEAVTKINRIAGNPAYPVDFSPVILKENSDALNSAVTLHAYDNTQTDGQFAEEKYRLLEGKPITENQNGILVNSQFAELNGFHIGDSLTFATESGSTAAGKIIGIFFSGMERRQDKSIVSAYRIENQIFVDHTLFDTLYGGGGYSSLCVYTDDPDHLSSLRQQVESLVEEDTSVTTSDLLYQQMQAPLKQVIRITSVMLALITATAIIVVSLLLCMWMRTRTKEMAVLISLGVSKGNLLLQSMTESFLLFGLSAVGAAAVSGLFASRMLRSLFKTSDYSALANARLEGIHLLMLLLLGGVIVLIAVGISALPTLRANPRDTLSKMEG